MRPTNLSGPINVIYFALIRAGGTAFFAVSAGGDASRFDVAHECRRQPGDRMDVLVFVNNK